nr:MAG TPA: hypothetical protein [Caudoviricetes sp.]
MENTCLNILTVLTTSKKELIHMISISPYCISSKKTIAPKKIMICMR